MLGRTGSKLAIKGTWIFPKALEGHAVLVSCPTGFRLINQSGHTFVLYVSRGLRLVLIDVCIFLTRYTRTGSEVQQCRECARFFYVFALCFLSHIRAACCSCSCLFPPVLRPLLTRELCSGEFMFDSTIPMLPCQTCPPQGICPNKGTHILHTLDERECVLTHIPLTLCSMHILLAGRPVFNVKPIESSMVSPSNPI